MKIVKIVNPDSITEWYANEDHTEIYIGQGMLNEFKEKHGVNIINAQYLVIEMQYYLSGGVGAGQRKNIIITDFDSGAELHAHLRDLIDLIVVPSNITLTKDGKKHSVYKAKLKIYYNGGGYRCKVWKGKEDGSK